MRTRLFAALIVCIAAGCGKKSTDEGSTANPGTGMQAATPERQIPIDLPRTYLGLEFGMGKKQTIAKVRGLKKGDDAFSFFGTSIMSGMSGMEEFLDAYNAYVPHQEDNLFSTYELDLQRDGMEKLYVLFYKGKILGIRGDFSSSVLKSIKFGDLVNKAKQKYGEPIESVSRRIDVGADHPPADSDVAYWRDERTMIAIFGEVMRMGNSQFFDEFPTFSISFLDRSVVRELKEKSSNEADSSKKKELNKVKF